MAKEGPAEPQGGGKGEGKGLKEGQGGKEEGKGQEEDPPLPPLRRLRAAARLLRQVVGASSAEAGRQGPGRALRWTAQVRHAGLRAAHVRGLAAAELPAGGPGLALVLARVPPDADEGGEAPMEEGEEEKGAAALPPAADGAIPEVETYVFLVAVMYLMDQKQVEAARAVATHAVEVHLAGFNRRTMDVLAARMYFYYSWAHESLGELDRIRGTLMALQRKAHLHHDQIGQETLLNLLLHNYLYYNLYDQAEKLRSKTQLPEANQSTQQQCRYLYYLGRIRAIQLEYTEAKESLQQALRKAPAVAKGFRISLHRWLAVVQLLLGEIPARNHFTTPGMRKALRPYFELTQAVRSGDLRAFQEVASQNEAQFFADKTHNLIVRLRNNVIRTGLRRISLAYNRISLEDVSSLLGLPSKQDAESIVAKAIRDGGVDAVISHENSWLLSKDVVDVYATMEPKEAFHARAAFCLDLHNETVKAMSYEPDAHKQGLESAEARKERLAQEQELAASLEDDEDF